MEMGIATPEVKLSIVPLNDAANSSYAFIDENCHRRINRALLGQIEDKVFGKYFPVFSGILIVPDGGLQHLQRRVCIIDGLKKSDVVIREY